MSLIRGPYGARKSHPKIRETIKQKLFFKFKKIKNSNKKNQKKNSTFFFLENFLSFKTYECGPWNNRTIEQNLFFIFKKIQN